MIDGSTLYTVEYSADQDAFHIATLKEATTANLRQLLGHRQQNDYKILAVCETRDEAHEVARYVRQHIGWRGTQHVA